MKVYFVVPKEVSVFGINISRTKTDFWYLFLIGKSKLKNQKNSKLHCSGFKLLGF